MIGYPCEIRFVGLYDWMVWLADGWSIAHDLQDCPHGANGVMLERVLNQRT
jgi:hypothetical protein